MATSTAENSAQEKPIEKRVRRDSKAIGEVNRLRAQPHHENAGLRHNGRALHGKAFIIGRRAEIQRVVAQAQQVAPLPSTVLLLGETGTGKERFAEYIHEASPRRDRAMVRVNCAAIPTALIESELFAFRSRDAGHRSNIRPRSTKMAPR